MYIYIYICIYTFIDMRELSILSILIKLMVRTRPLVGRDEALKVPPLHFPTQPYPQFLDARKTNDVSGRSWAVLLSWRSELPGIHGILCWWVHVVTIGPPGSIRKIRKNRSELLERSASLILMAIGHKYRRSRWRSPLENWEASWLRRVCGGSTLSKGGGGCPTLGK